MEELLTAALGQGLYAALFVFLLFWVLRKNEERENNYRKILEQQSAALTKISCSLEQMERQLNRLDCSSWQHGRWENRDQPVS